MISYAQNAEDVVLMRGLSDVFHGFYIDVGAAHPKIDNVTQAFYLKGWTGINLEPDPELYKLLSRFRPRDININAGVGSSESTLSYYRFPKTGFSNFDREQADAWVRNGLPHEVLSVPVLTLDKILTQRVSGTKDIHFLKIDVEGFAKAVLEGIDLTRFRPWVIVLGATKPNTNTLVESEWQHILLKANYRRCLFDGINVYYCAAERPNVAARISYPANVLDNSVPIATHEQSLALSRELQVVKAFRRAALFNAKYKNRKFPAPDFSQSGQHWPAVVPASPVDTTSAKPALIVDLTNLVKHNIVTGIERVTLNISACLIRLQPRLGHELVFVAFNGKSYERKFVHISRVGSQDVFDVSAGVGSFSLKRGDCWLSCELMGEVPKLERFYLKLRKQGICVNFWVHDIFPLVHPEWSSEIEMLWFDEWWATVRKVADNMLCVSWKTKVQVERWMDTFARDSASAGPDPSLVWFRLGADGVRNIEYKEKSSQPLTANVGFELRKDARASFMSLASLHPRKGLEMLIDAFEILWARGVDVDLVLTGRMYSNDNPLVARINSHPQLNKKLFYAGYVSDRALEKLFAQCDGLIYPSLDEGFGLPVVEALHAGVPVFLRDIPVMREAAASCPAYWFADDGPESMAAVIADYLDKPPAARERQRLQGDSSLLTWSQLSVQMLGFLGVSIREE